MLPEFQTPIVFIHCGGSWYLPYVLSQAKFTNPNSKIVLLGDSSALERARKIKGIDTELLDNLQSKSTEIFGQNYCHMSSHSEEFETFCWLRWFYLLEYMRRNHIPSVFHCDSDILLYSSIEKIKEKYRLGKSKACGFLIPKQSFDSLLWFASGHFSFWDSDSIREFCEFSIDSFTNPNILALYKQKYNDHLTGKKPGGVCDMTTLYLFWKQDEDRVENLAISHDANMIDVGISSGSNYVPNEYIIDSGRPLKKIRFIDGHPFTFLTEKPKTLVKVHALHFQGHSKKYIKEFATCVHFFRYCFKLTNHLLSLKNHIKSVVKSIVLSSLNKR